MNAKNPVTSRYDSPAFTLTLHLFRQCLDDLGMDTEQAEGLCIRDFYSWMQDRAELHSFMDFPLFPDKDELQELLGADDAIFEALELVFSDPFETCTRVYPWWPLLSLSSRRPLQHQVSGIAITLEIKYLDGHSIVVPMSLGDQEEPYTDGMILTLWRAQLNQAVNALAEVGFDDLYEEHCVGESSDGVIDMHNVKNDVGGMGL